MEDVKVSVELPKDAGNQFQNKTANILVTVEAIQGNAEVEGSEEVHYFVSNAEDLKQVLKKEQFHQTINQ